MRQEFSCSNNGIRGFTLRRHPTLLQKTTNLARAMLIVHASLKFPICTDSNFPSSFSALRQKNLFDCQKYEGQLARAAFSPQLLDYLTKAMKEEEHKCELKFYPNSSPSVNRFSQGIKPTVNDSEKNNLNSSNRFLLSKLKINRFESLVTCSC